MDWEKAIVVYGLALHSQMYLIIDVWDIIAHRKSLWDELYRRRFLSVLSVDISFLHFLFEAINIFSGQE